jgi:DNA repair protein RadA/Sms
MPITQVPPVDAPRLITGDRELDRVLGGGAALGSAVLVGGDPGIGKSTLLLQAAHRLAEAGGRALYVTAEESTLQTRLRAERLGAMHERLLLMAETDLDAVSHHWRALRPDMVVVDSIQMVYCPDLPSAPGSVAQVREGATRLVYLAKQTGAPLFLVGHVTKGGVIAGPRTLEHLVDTVLYFEGERFHAFRLLRAVKNRFGSTNEIGVFEMRDQGLAEVENPSSVFLSDLRSGVTGSVVAPCLEGSRSILVEIQALLAQTHYGSPERKVSGVDYQRVCMLLAVLEQRAGLQLGGMDVFVNVVGGVRVEEPAADLAISLAIASSFSGFPVPREVVLVGEIGLGGEVRTVSRLDARLSEAARLGFRTAYVPRGASVPDRGQDMTVHPVGALSEAIEALR